VKKPKTYAVAGFFPGSFVFWEGRNMSAKTKPAELCAGLYLRIPPRDLEQLDETALRLGMKRSELARRAVREGLKTFRDVQLPGSEARPEP
jgi:hypothetical protein